VAGFTTFGFSVRVVGGNPRTAQLVGLPASRSSCWPARWAAPAPGLAGAVEVAAVHTSANASLIVGYGYTGILVAFIARHNPLAIIPVAILFGRLRRRGQPVAAARSTCPMHRFRCCRALPVSC
jgi:simple sugar transport system permease protein